MTEQKYWQLQSELDDHLMRELAYDRLIKTERNSCENAVEDAPTAKIDGNTSDGIHTFNELHHHRAVLYYVLAKKFPDKMWKAKKHHDGSMFDGMFVVGISTPYGQATYHYADQYWDLFECKEIEFAPE